jgi:hypothetical protein
MAYYVPPSTRRRPRHRAHATSLLSAALLAGFVATTVSAHAVSSPAGPPYRVDDGDFGCGLVEPAVVAAPDSLHAVWREVDRIVLRDLDAAGRGVGEELQIASGQPLQPAIEIFAAGDFLVAWFDTARSQVLARRVGPERSVGPELVLGSISSADAFAGLALARAAGGEIVAAWADGGSVVMRTVSSTGTPLGPSAYPVASYFGVLGVDPRLYDPVLLPREDGAVRVYWVLAGEYVIEATGQGMVEGMVVRPESDGTFDTLGMLYSDLEGYDLAGAQLADGSYVLAVGWTETGIFDPPFPGPNRLPRGQLFDGDDTGGVVFEFDDGGAQWLSLAGLALTATPDGGFTAVWEGLPLAGDGSRLVFARDYAADGTPGGPLLTVPANQGFDALEPALATSPDGLPTVLWSHGADTTTPPCPGGTAIFSRQLTIGCGAPGAFCVDSGRFHVALDYHDPRRALLGTGNGVALTADSGYFWFFAHDNVEVVVKVLDGRASNGHYWVFYGGLTDVGFTLTVTDTATGAVRTFEHPAGTMASRGITNAFPAASTGSAGIDLSPLRAVGLMRDAFPGDSRRSLLAPVAVPADLAGGVPGSTTAAAITGVPPCSPPELPVVPGPGLCLEGRRFSVVARWRDFAGNTGVATGVPLGDDSGYFWFFDPTNVELVVKVLDGRPLNGHFWVFYGALSNVEYDLEVEHVFGNESGADGEAAYHNPLGTFGSRGDTGALRPPQDQACPPFYDPVCGRDGRTYGNWCEARLNGWVDVAHPGPC